jgi:hypothetical protein
MPYYDDPAVCYDGTPSASLIGQLISAVQANPQAVLAALQAAPLPLPVNAVQMAGAAIVGDGSEANMWRGAGVSP